MLVNGIALTGACESTNNGNPWTLNVTNQAAGHGSNGQVGVISQDMAVTYTNFTVSYGVPTPGANGNLGPMFALQSLISPSYYNLDDNGATTSGSAASVYYTTAKNPSNYTGQNPPAPVSWTANTQLWRLRSVTVSGAPGGSVQITNVANGLCLDLSGSNVVQNTCNSSIAKQAWWFIPTSTNGAFAIENVQNSSVIDANNVSVGGQLVTTAGTGATSQQWQLISQ